jgi:hypothetical protein
VSADGTAVITKLSGTGGRVDHLTCTAQLLYEVEDPSRYLQPDVVGDFSQVRFATVGQHRVQVQGAGGLPRPDTLKVTLGYRDGFIGEGQISYAGPGARARGELALAILRHRLEVAGLTSLEHRAELVGVNAMHGPHLGVAHEPYEVRVRLSVRCVTRQQAERVGQEVEALYLNGPAGGGGVTQSVREVVAAASAWMPRSAVQTHVQVLTHGVAETPERVACRQKVSSAHTPLAPCTSAANGPADPPCTSGTVGGGDTVGTRVRPLCVQDIAIARSGDKGNRATLTVIARDPVHYPLLERLLTPGRVRAHYHGVVLGEVQRHLLPHLGAVHFVMHDALGGGVTRSLALDAHGKTLSAAILSLPLDMA